MTRSILYSLVIQGCLFPERQRPEILTVQLDWVEGEQERALA